jgi:MerR HTH family regulatory protein
MSRALESGGIAERRKNLLVGLTGEVLDIGAGTRPSFGHYPDTVTRVLAAEPPPRRAPSPRPPPGLSPFPSQAYTRDVSELSCCVTDLNGEGQVMTAAQAAPLMTVGELSRRTGVPVKALREYTVWGVDLQPGPQRRELRALDDEALRCVQAITELRGLGLTCRRPVACLPGRSGHDRAVPLQGLPPPWPGMLLPRENGRPLDRHTVTRMINRAGATACTAAPPASPPTTTARPPGPRQPGTRQPGTRRPGQTARPQPGERRRGWHRTGDFNGVTPPGGPFGLRPTSAATRRRTGSPCRRRNHCRSATPPRRRRHPACRPGPPGRRWRERTPLRAPARACQPTTGCRSLRGGHHVDPQQRQLDAQRAHSRIQPAVHHGNDRPSRLTASTGHWPRPARPARECR